MATIFIAFDSIPGPKITFSLYYSFFGHEEGQKVIVDEPLIQIGPPRYVFPKKGQQVGGAMSSKFTRNNYRQQFIKTLTHGNGYTVHEDSIVHMAK